MKNKIVSLFKKGGIALALVATTLVVGCSTTNKQQIVNTISGDGVYGKVAVPITSSTSIGASLFVGRMNNTTVVQPTDTNKVYAPSLTVAAAGAGKQSVSGGTTNTASAGITDGSRDVSILTTGDAALSAGSGTNTLLNITGGK